jgi:hypothetical protein
MEELEKF